MSIIRCYKCEKEVDTDFHEVFEVEEEQVCETCVVRTADECIGCNTDKFKGNLTATPLGTCCRKCIDNGNFKTACEAAYENEKAEACEDGKIN